MDLQMPFGAGQVLSWAGADDSEIRTFNGPPALQNPSEHVIEALEAPLEYPPLAKAILPGDRIVLAWDAQLPSAPQILSGLWRMLAAAQISPADVLILESASHGEQALDPRSELPESIRSEMQWKRHDPQQENATGYLATSLSGERIYLARELLDADFVLPVGRVAFDPVLGVHTAASVIYPGLSTAQSQQKARGEGHRELQPDHDRPLRQLQDEAAWLLGVQLGINVLPSGEGTAAEIFAGTLEAAGRAARQRLDATWRIRLPARVDTIVAGVSAVGGKTCWADVAAAAAAAESLVERGGRIVLLTDLAEDPGTGLEMLRGQASPTDALPRLRKAAPIDVLTASQWAHAADRASVYLLSHIESNVVEDLFAIPLEHSREAERLLAGQTGGLCISSAQYAWCELDD